MRTLRLFLLCLSVLSGSFASGQTSPAGVVFTWTNQWSGGGQAAITITNNGTAAIQGWSLEFAWAGEITSLWNGVILNHSGPTYQVIQADYNANIPVGGSVVIGCVANLADSSAAPSNVTFNGTPAGGGAALAVSTTSLPAAGVGVLYSQPLAASGGTAPYTWSLQAGTLPGGFTLSSGGAVSGTTAAAGSANFTVRVTDAASATASRALSITAASLPSLAISDASIILQPPVSGGTNGYLSTRGNQIVDAGGNPVRITGINWFGFETSNRVLHGLWTRNYQQALDQIHQLGFNTLRIPFSNAMLQAGAATRAGDRIWNG